MFPTTSDSALRPGVVARLHPALVDGQAGLDGHPELMPQLFQRAAFRLAADISEKQPRLIEPLADDWLAPSPLFAKLGAKSWRDSGSIKVIITNQPVLQCLTTLLGQLSDTQQSYLSLVRPYRSALDLMLFPYVDFSNISEARWHYRDGRETLSTRCMRGASAAHAGASQDRMRDLVLRAGSALGCDAIIDLAVEPDGRISILEVNPFRSQLPGRDAARPT